MGAHDARYPHAIDLPPRYEAERWLADGGMASVWSAEDRLLDRKVAVKLVSGRFLADGQAVRRLEREARAAARLSGHPHVVAIFDVGETAGGRPFIVMEHLSGGSVADALRAGNVDREQALHWIREAASALDHAHANGVIHRDIKPGNLLLDGQRNLRVADFGIASLTTEDTITDRDLVMGTAAYLSPEQALGEGATEASDRYSLAIVAYELLVGTRPFNAEPLAAQARQHVETQPPRASRRNRTLPRAVDAVLDRGLAKHPGDRWETASAFADALARACGGRILSFERRHRATVVAPAAGRRTGGRAVALASLAAAAFAIGIAAADSGGPQPTGRARAHVLAPATASPASNRLMLHRATPRPHPHSQPTQTATQVAETTPPPTADTLEAQGHALMVGGNYAAAIPVLRQAVNAADPSSLIYAYALYDLGRSLRLSGDPQAAIPVLYHRLQIPNQTDVVRQELALALQAVGQRFMYSGGTAVGGPPGQSGKHHGHPGHGGGDGGD